MWKLKKEVINKILQLIECLNEEVSKFLVLISYFEYNIKEYEAYIENMATEKC